MTIKRTTPISESASLESTLKNIVNNSTHIIQVYEALKSMAQKWVHNNGNLKGFHRNAAGVGARWFDQFYFNKLQKELYDLSKQAPTHAAPLVQYLRFASTGWGVTFKDISEELPLILKQLGSKMKSPELERFATIWSQRRDEYYNFLDTLLNDNDDDEPQSGSGPKDNIIGQQTSQIEKIVNDVLSTLPKNVAGEIRNAIARSGNKLVALKQELDKRGISLGESIKQAADNLSEKKDPCWKGYKMVGTKTKGSKKVPNCVPVGESVEKTMAAYISLLESK